MTSFQNQAIEQAHFWINLANELYNMSIPYPNVSFKLRGKTAGQAKGKKEVKFNAVLLEENGEKFLNNTVPHEIAHIVQQHKYPRSQAHGYEWQSIMLDFGVPPRRCHSYDTSNSTISNAKYHYKCACKTHLITLTRHKRAMQGTTYTCKHCKQSIKQVA